MYNERDDNELHACVLLIHSYACLSATRKLQVEEEIRLFNVSLRVLILQVASTESYNMFGGFQNGWSHGFSQLTDLSDKVQKLKTGLEAGLQDSGLLGPGEAPPLSQATHGI